MWPHGQLTGASPALSRVELGAWASSLILIGSPRELHIPYFAMGVRWLRENRVERLDLGTDLDRLVGRRCAAWIKAR
ncbi:MAG TPA: hypothetical protein VLE20_08575, partial [Blastocatellia bacterium]|nr:hypothetical protein [Blastocatellia bacterium]